MRVERYRTKYPARIIKERYIDIRVEKYINKYLSRFLKDR